MLLSLEKKFLYVHVPKTGGTSITSVLKPWCVEPEHSQWRRLLSHLPVREAPERAWLRQHDKAAWVRHKLSPEVYDPLFSFAVVRNPYDFAVSYFHFLRKNKSSRRHVQAQDWDFLAMLRYLDRKNRLVAVDQTSWLADRSGTLIVDRILRFETLDADFAALTEELGLGVEITLPRLNTTKRSDYRSYYEDPEARRLVERIFARDIERFGYAF